MIYVFGDSWGFSYVPGSAFNDIISGADLAECLSVELNQPAINYAHRGLDNTQIVSSIRQRQEEIQPGSILVVLQTDPLRNLVCSWHPGTEPYGYTFTGPRNIHEICDDVLDTFYSSLATIQKDLQVNILLHGGCSKLNHVLARKHGLDTTIKTSTEIICPGFKDTYYYVDMFVMHSHEKLRSASEQYNFSKEQAFDLFVQVKQKEIHWRAQPDLFTVNHTTEAGTRQVAKHIALEISVLKNSYPSTFSEQFQQTAMYQQLQMDYKYISFEPSFSDYLKQFDDPMNLKRLAWETKERTPRQGYDKLGSYFSAVPFYYINFLLEQQPALIADIGCGGNHFKKYIPQITGYDINVDADVKTYFSGAFAREHKEKFDAAFSICSIHYINIDQIYQQLTDFASIIKPGGRGFVAMNYQRLLDSSTSKPVTPTLALICQIRDAIAQVNVKPLVLDILVTDDPITHDAFLDGNIRFVFETLQNN